MQNKIFWYGFKRNLAELYYLLIAEKFISCDIDEFISHFTGKKFRIEINSKAKINWLKEKYFLVSVLHHLSEKGFLKDIFMDEGLSLLKLHFKGLTKADFVNHAEYNNNPSLKILKQKLECLFPEISGLRCKTRLFYKERNKQSLSSVLESCRIKLNSI